jgi:glycosyltransferase involved in cell wall biosynthesis
MSGIVSVVIPTRNRARTLARVIESYCRQESVHEVIVVDDCSEDDTAAVVAQAAATLGVNLLRYSRQDQRRGAAFCKAAGASMAVSEFVLFGEDDAFLSGEYCGILLRKFQSAPEVGIASGRIIYMLPQESADAARQRFGYGLEKALPFNKWTFTLRANSYFQGDAFLPFTHALFMTRRSLLNSLGMDLFYCRGNGFREETDFQMKAFTEGLKILVTNDTHCFHFSREEVRAGGQRSSLISQFAWNNYYTYYFFKKYYNRAGKILGLPYPRAVGQALFFFHQAYLLFIRPLRRLPGMVMNLGKS